MPVGLLQRNRKYFNDKLDQADKNIYAADLDAQFNEISTYLNTIMKPAIDNLVAGVVGVVGFAGSYLRNVGDGTTDWQLIGGNAIDDYSVMFAKFVKVNAGSILAAGVGGVMETVTSNANNQVLVSTINNVPEWRKLDTPDFANNFLTGAQIGQQALTLENFVRADIVNNIADNSVTSDMMSANCITTAKALDESITDEAISNLPIPANVNYSIFYKQTFNYGIDSSKFAANSVSAKHFSYDKPLDKPDIFLPQWLKNTHFYKFSQNNYYYNGLNSISYDMINTSGFRFMIDSQNAYEGVYARPYYRYYPPLGYQPGTRFQLNQAVLDALRIKFGVVDSDWLP